jgi:hypothetical protein
MASEDGGANALVCADLAVQVLLSLMATQLPFDPLEENHSNRYTLYEGSHL